MRCQQPDQMGANDRAVWLVESGPRGGDGRDLVRLAAEGVAAGQQRRPPRRRAQLAVPQHRFLHVAGQRHELRLDPHRQFGVVNAGADLDRTAGYDRPPGVNQAEWRLVVGHGVEAAAGRALRAAAAAAGGVKEERLGGQRRQLPQVGLNGQEAVGHAVDGGIGRGHHQAHEVAVYAGHGHAGRGQSQRVAADAAAQVGHGARPGGGKTRRAVGGYRFGRGLLQPVTGEVHLRRAGELMRCSLPQQGRL